jgi:hypothetical protein
MLLMCCALANDQLLLNYPTTMHHAAAFASALSTHCPAPQLLLLTSSSCTNAAACYELHTVTKRPCCKFTAAANAAAPTHSTTLQLCTSTCCNWRSCCCCWPAAALALLHCHRSPACAAVLHNARIHTCMRPLLVCLRLGLLLQRIKVHSEQLHTLTVGPLLPHGPYSCHTLGRVEQHCSILHLLLLLAGTAAVTGATRTYKYGAGLGQQHLHGYA